MLVEPGAPDEADRIAGLQGRAEPRRAPAAHEAEMAAVSAGHRLHDRRTLAVLANADDEPFVAPLHPSALLGDQQHLSNILAVLDEMMGDRGLIEWKGPRDLRLDRALLPQAHQLV